MKYALWMIAILFPAFASAELKLAPPQELLAKAARSRVACREVILDIQQNVPEMRSPEVFDAYFGILDTLAELAKIHRMDEIYPEAVKRLGIQMTSNGIRWLSLARDPFPRIIGYHRWMNQDVAYSFLSNSEIEVKMLEDGTARQFALNAEQLIPYIDQAFPQAAGLRMGYRNLLSDLAGRKMVQEGLSDEEILFWLGKIRTPSGYGTALSAVQNSLIVIRKEDRARLHVFIQRVLVLGKGIFADRVQQEFWLLGQLGDVATQAIFRMTELKEEFATGEFPSLLALLQPRHLQSVSQVWISEERTPDDAYAAHYLFLTGQLLEVLDARGLTQEAILLRRYEARLAAPVVAKSKKLEGTYKVVSGSGKRWTFTAALARESTLYVALQDEVGFVGKGFFNVTYASGENTFVASEREVDTDSQRNMTLKFRLLENGKIEVRDLMAVPEEQLLRGSKTENYPSYFPESSSTLQDPSGTYEGMVYIGDKFAKKMTLVVTAFSGYTLARLSDENRSLYVDFNIGTRATDSVLYLTTGRLQMGWLQLRGVVKNGEYRGYAVSGGRGLAAREFVLKKVRN